MRAKYCGGTANEYEAPETFVRLRQHPTRNRDRQHGLEVKLSSARARARDKRFNSFLRLNTSLDYFYEHTKCIRLSYLDSPWEASRRDSGARVFEMWYPVTSWDFLRGSVVPPSYYTFICVLFIISVIIIRLSYLRHNIMCFIKF